MKSNNSIKLWFTALMVAVFLSACASSQDEVLDPDADTGQGSDVQFGTISGGDTGADASGVDNQDDDGVIAIEDTTPLTPAQALEQTEGALASRTIYFEYDSAKLSDESLAILEEHGNFIAANGEVRVRLEGHADERGSREYNIALGDRRAQSVRRVLLFQGASVDQINTVSYGEESPAVEGHDEEAWAKNRRVELKYRVN